MSDVVATNPWAQRTADHALLLYAVREAGAVAKRFFDGTVKHWEKGPDNPVSEADYAVDKLLTETLRGARPDYGWLSEESEDDSSRLSAEKVFVVDPIDGTRAFLKKEPEFTVVAALVEAGRPVIGVVYNPAKDEMFEAMAGSGARMNGVSIQCSTVKSLVGARLLSSARTFRGKNWGEAANGAIFRFVNSMAYRLALVASGQFDATVTLTQKADWDLAAAHVILNEAGGLISTLSGEELLYNRESVLHPNVVAAGPGLHPQLVAGLS